MGVTVLAAAEAYRRLNMQSGYWVPMTALLVQKPAFAETFNRALMRIAGTRLREPTLRRLRSLTSVRN